MGSSPLYLVLHIGLFVCSTFVRIINGLMYQPTLYPIVAVSIDYIAISCLEIDTRRVAGFLTVNHTGLFHFTNYGWTPIYFYW